jgi:uncharacterized protein
MKRSEPTPQANLPADANSSYAIREAVPNPPTASTVQHDGISRRKFLAGAAGAALLSTVHQRAAWAEEDQATTVNLAKVAIASSLYTSGDTKLSALNDGAAPEDSRDNRGGSWGTWPRLDSQWVQYEWTRPVTTGKVDLYWWIDGAGVGAPASWRILYWNGSEFVPVANPRGLGTAPNQFNTTAFDPVTTTKLRLELTSDGKLSPGILEWQVFSSGPVPLFPPTVNAGIDRAVVLDGKTYLSGKADWLVPGPGDRVRWTKESGPGHVTFAGETMTETTAMFS